MTCFREAARRGAFAALFAFAGYLPAGCASVHTALPPMPRFHAPLAAAPAPRPVIASIAPGGFDLGTVISDARNLESDARRAAVELPALRRALTLCTLALMLVGAVNAGLLVAVLRALGRRTAAVIAEPAAAAAVAVPVLEASPGRTCACGTPVSERSRSGRCRACANRSRGRGSAGGGVLRGDTVGDRRARRV